MDASAKNKFVERCEICGETNFWKMFLISDCWITQCNACDFLFCQPQSSDDALAAIYSKHYFLHNDDKEKQVAFSQMKQATAKNYLSQIAAYSGFSKGRLLEVGCGEGDFLVVAEAMGWDVVGVDCSQDACEKTRQRVRNGEVYCGELDQLALVAESFDLCVISDVLEHVRSPIYFLQVIHHLLKLNGVLYVGTPSTDSWSAYWMGKKWMEYKLEHLSYFNRKTLQTALFKTGFCNISIEPGWKMLSFDYVKMHFDRYPVWLVTKSLQLLSFALPKKMQQKPYKVIASGMVALSRKVKTREIQVLSIIIPVYNEAQTFSVLMNQLLQKKIPGIQFEIIVVESNSTDGTRALAQSYKNHAAVKLILENKPRGKGFAVRAGLAAATGDYILIQDADLEYDIADYDALLAPIISGKAAFVLGSRRANFSIWRMRQIADQPLLSLFINFGHCFFAGMINFLFLLNLRDPFTMFKVFRRECLYGLEFKCNRFDFDGELLIKLIRKGYRPIEIPVHYQSRSFEEGKKVRVFLDSFCLFRTIVLLRIKTWLEKMGRKKWKANVEST